MVGIVLDTGRGFYSDKSGFKVDTAMSAALLSHQQNSEVIPLLTVVVGVIVLNDCTTEHR